MQIVLLDDQLQEVATFERSWDEMKGVSVVKHNGQYYRNEMMTGSARRYFQPTKVIDLDVSA